MEVMTFDLVVLGGGSAGYAAARTASGLGLTVAVIDGSRELGGLCILRGCMPSKTLIESANRAVAIREAGKFGLETGKLRVNVPAIQARKRKLIGGFAGYRQEQLWGGEFELIRGAGRFGGASRVDVALLEGGERRVDFRTALIATGSEVSVPPVPGLAETGYWTSDEVLEAAELPESFVVLGGGAVAVEMAYYLAGVGVEVTLIQRSEQLLRDLDLDVAEVVREGLEARGVRVICGTVLEGVARSGVGKRVRLRKGGEVMEVVGREVLASLGRRAATGGLGLDHAGVVLEEDGRVRVDERMVTSHGAVYAAGDVCGPLEVVHVAIAQGEAAAWNAAVALGKVEGEERRMDYRLKLFGVFAEPQAASVGATEKELRERGERYRCAVYPFADHGKSMVMGVERGFVKLLADGERGEILGGAVVGPEAVELIHEIAVAMHFRATAGDVARVPHYHPTLSEIWTYPAEELAMGGGKVMRGEEEEVKKS